MNIDRAAYILATGMVDCSLIWAAVQRPEWWLGLLILGFLVSTGFSERMKQWYGE